MSLWLAVFLGLLGASSALYKQWVPDTNFNNQTNWDPERVPCADDRVVFAPHKKVAVFVQALHSILEMMSGVKWTSPRLMMIIMSTVSVLKRGSQPVCPQTLPLDGEILLAPDSGLVASAGRDPGCEGGQTVSFKDSDRWQWFDPPLWQAADSSEGLERGNFLFSVHEESVPCQTDDVVFRGDSSFRVDASSDRPLVPLRSLSVLGQRFLSDAELTRYLRSRLGQLQIHGDSAPQNHERICAAVRQRGPCPQLDCKKPLRPAGHCCDICGAIVMLQFSPDFRLDSYRQRLQHLFLAQPVYRAVRMAVSKVSRPRWLLGLIPRQGPPQIQVALLDPEPGSGPGAVAESLAHSIVEDALSQGWHLGITQAELQASSDSGSGSDGGVVAGAVIGVLLLLAALLLLGFLWRRGTIRMPSLPSWRKGDDIEDLGGPADIGFDNPMFDKPDGGPSADGLYGVDALNTVSFTQSGVHFSNPAYDETDFNA
ncbi:protein amnionless isoform X1 [Amia ocellicauda]|uniref:protein amnionless isoform X1 n=1 Tax=Amia ocellicauda TaxID=2972642 RepID=UPI0034646581